ncbi:hypothetical protein C8R43DRAFT_1135644 [Mycena crocata]|nr:hypothetical protein C8R43DRAFT_1135644 [Mycena crocata]
MAAALEIGADDGSDAARSASSLTERKGGRPLPRKPVPKIKNVSETRNKSSRVETERAAGGVSVQSNCSDEGDLSEDGGTRQKSGESLNLMVLRVPVDSQLFRFPPDSTSGAEIATLAKTLNANIFQTAALLADSLEFSPIDRSIETWRDDIWKELELGRTLMDLLATTERAAIQIVIQTALCRWCKHNIEAWCFDDPRFEASLSQLYAKIVSAEDQATAGKWRAVTRAQTGSSNEDSLLTSSLLECLFHVVVAAGWRIQGASDGRAFIRSHFGEQMFAIVKYSLQIRKSIGEEMVSEDLEVAYIQPNRTFNAKTMDDTDAGTRAGNRVRPAAMSVVACTSDIGLQRKKLVGEVDAKDVLLRPKVLLEYRLQEML